MDPDLLSEFPDKYSLKLELRRQNGYVNELWLRWDEAVAVIKVKLGIPKPEYAHLKKDWALNENIFKDTVEALRRERIKMAWILLTDNVGYYVAHAPIAVLMKSLQDVAPRKGNHGMGDYWYINVDFQPIGVVNVDYDCPIGWPSR